jgi:hypothetical protein
MARQCAACTLFVPFWQGGLNVCFIYIFHDTFEFCSLALIAEYIPFGHVGGNRLPCAREGGL